MARPPRAADASVHRRAACGSAWSRSALVMAVVDAAGARPVPARRADRGHARPATTRAPLASRRWCFAQLFNCFNARSETASAFRRPVRQPLAVGRDRAVGCCCRWRSSTCRFLNVAFGTVPLDLASGWSARRWPASCCGSASCARPRCARCAAECRCHEATRLGAPARAPGQDAAVAGRCDHAGVRNHPLAVLRRGVLGLGAGDRVLAAAAAAVGPAARPAHTGRAGRAAMALILVLVILPATLIAASLLQDGVALVERIRSGELDLGQHLRQASAALPAWATGVLDRFELRDLGALQERLSSGLMQGLQVLATRVFAVGGNTLQFIVSFFIMLYLLFFLLRDGGALCAARPQRDSARRANCSTVCSRKFTDRHPRHRQGHVVVAARAGRARRPDLLVARHRRARCCGRW